MKVVRLSAVQEGDFIVLYCSAYGEEREVMSLEGTRLDLVMRDGSFIEIHLEGPQVVPSTNNIMSGTEKSEKGIR